MNQQLIDDLKATKEALKEHGRCKGDYGTAEGRVCLLGAMGLVIFDNVYALRNCGGYEMEGWKRYRAVCDAIRTTLPDCQHLPDYNDSESTTDSDIYNVIDKALAEVGGML